MPNVLAFSYGARFMFLLYIELYFSSIESVKEDQEEQLRLK